MNAIKLCIYILYIFSLCKQLTCSQIPQLPKIYSNTPRYFFTNNKDFIEHQRELNQAYADIKRLSIQNTKTLKKIQKLTQAFLTNNSKSPQNLLPKLEEVAHRVILHSMQTTSPLWLKKREDYLHNISELTYVIKELQQDTVQLQFLEAICIYHTPIKHTPRT